MFKTLVLIGLSVILSVMGQFFLKLGINSLGKVDLLKTSNLISNIRLLASSPYIYLGFLAYGVSALSWLVTLSRADLSFAYPMMGLSFVLAAFVSELYLGESITMVRWAGIFVVVFGVVLISRT